MNVITEYDVVGFSKLEELIETVNVRLKNGWTLLGSIQVQTQPAPGGGYMPYLQTMAKVASSQA